MRWTHVQIIQQGKGSPGYYIVFHLPNLQNLVQIGEDTYKELITWCSLKHTAFRIRHNGVLEK